MLKTIKPHQFGAEGTVSRSSSTGQSRGFMVENKFLSLVGKMLLSACRDFWKDVLIYSKGCLFYRIGVNVLWRT